MPLRVPVTFTNIADWARKCADTVNALVSITDDHSTRLATLETNVGTLQTDVTALQTQIGTQAFPLPSYVDNAAALAGGLAAGDLYKNTTSTTVAFVV